MIRRRSPVPFLLLAALGALVHLRTRPGKGTGDSAPRVTLETARELFPGAAELSRELPGAPVEVRDAAGKLLGTVLDTTPRAGAHPGYGGPVPCAIGLSPDRRIVGVTLLANAESPTFVEFLREQGFLQRWNGLSPEEAAALPTDAVSGATMTCLAIAEPVRETLAAQASAPAPAAAPGMRDPWKVRLAWGALALAVLSAALGWLVPGLRVGSRLASLVVFGFIGGMCLSLALAQSWLACGVPWGRVPVLAAMAAAALGSALLLGRNLYCGHICPYGSAQDLAAMLWRGPRPRLPRWVVWGLRTLRGAVLIAAFLGVMAGVGVDLAAWEPFAAFQWRSAPGSAVLLALVFAVVSVVFPRAWCRHLCPTGALLGACRGRTDPEDAPRTLLSFERGVLAAALGAAAVLALRHPAQPPSGAAHAPPERDQGLDAAPARAHSVREVPDVLTAIHQRRSVRHYTDEPVTPAQLDTLVRAAMAAPSAGNAQPWAFVVVTEQSRLLGLSEALPYGKMLAKAGAGIVVCGVPAKGLPGEANSLWVLDCAAAAENILLAAHGIGLGAVWVGVYPYEDRMAGVRAVCGIPPDVQPLCVVSLGVPAGVEQPKDKYAPDKVHWERW